MRSYATLDDLVLEFFEWFRRSRRRSDQSTLPTSTAAYRAGLTSVGSCPLVPRVAGAALGDKHRRLHFRGRRFGAGCHQHARQPGHAAPCKQAPARLHDQSVPVSSTMAIQQIRYASLEVSAYLIPWLRKPFVRIPSSRGRADAEAVQQAAAARVQRRMRSRDRKGRLEQHCPHGGADPQSPRAPLEAWTAD